MRTSITSTKTKTYPSMRTCIACKTHENRKTLVRIVRSSQGNLNIHTNGTLAGRGAYLCKNLDCWGNGYVPQLLQDNLNLVNPPTQKILRALTKKAGNTILGSLNTKKGHKND